MHPENYQTSKIEFSLGNSQRLNSASRFCKKLPLRCLTEPQVRKIRDNTDSKGTSKLTRRHIQKSVKHSWRKSFQSRERLKSANLTQKIPLQTFNQVLDTSLDYIVLSVEQFQRNWGAMFVRHRPVLFHE